jgi:putative MATE family efflux protein
MPGFREFLKTLIRVALPIAVQNLITSSLNAVGVFLVGQLGETPVAAVGLANQIYFLLSLALFGITSGSAIFTAQYWGNEDLPGIRRVVALCLAMSLVMGALFTVVALGFPQAALGLYTDDPAVIELGSQYLRIIGISYLATAVMYVFSSQLRSTGDVRPPMLVSVVALSFGTLLNYLLIFGKFGLPEMGVSGAALGTCIARIAECAAILLVTYLGRKPTVLRLADVKQLDLSFVRKFMFTVLPVAANEITWSLGFTIYNVIYAHISTEAIAAVNITSTIESLTFVVFTGIANGVAIIIGNRIGAGEEDKAYHYAWWTLIMGVALAVVFGGALALSAEAIISLYKISPESALYARNILWVLSAALWVRVSNQTIIVGILRSGGDTRFSLVLDSGSVWFVGIPMALLGAFVFHLPVYWVFAMVLSDDVTKVIGGMYRFLSRKWINNLAQAVA